MSLIDPLHSKLHFWRLRTVVGEYAGGHSLQQPEYSENAHHTVTSS